MPAERTRFRHKAFLILTNFNPRRTIRPDLNQDDLGQRLIVRLRFRTIIPQLETTQQIVASRPDGRSRSWRIRVVSLRQLITPLFFAAVFACELGSPDGAFASGITTNNSTYELINLSPTGSKPVSVVVADINPPGAIVPPNSQTSPLTILPGSSGFDPNALTVNLGNTPATATTPAQQALGLGFGNGGFQPGGVLDFSLSTAPNLQGPIQFTLAQGMTDLVFKALQSTQTSSDSNPSSTSSSPSSDSSTPPPASTGSGSSSTSTPTAVFVPEPASLVAWSAPMIFLAVSRRIKRRRLLEM
jgi:hypothetical protein